MRPERWIYTVPMRLRSLFRRPQVDQDLDEEIRDHLERRTEDFVSQGMSLEAARYAARREFGGVEQVKEKCRDTRKVNWIYDLVQDHRYAVRQFLKSPGFTISAILSLTLGIGTTTAFFSLVYAVVFDPFPYKDANRIVYVQLQGKEPGYGPFRANGSQFEGIRSAPSVEDVFFQTPPGITTLTGESSRVIVKADS